MAGNSSELWRAAWMPLACIAECVLLQQAGIGMGRGGSGSAAAHSSVCACRNPCIGTKSQVFGLTQPQVVCSLAWMSQISEHTPLWLRWDWPGWAKCSETQVWASCVSVPSSITAFQVTFQSETLPKGGERKPRLTRALHRDPANRWCLHIGDSGRVQLHYNSWFLMIAGGLNSGYIWNS